MSIYLRTGIPSACSIYPQNLSTSAQITSNKTPSYGTNSTNTCQYICATEYLALAAFTLRIHPFQHKSHPTRHLRTGPIPQTHANLLRHGIPSACSIYPENLSISAQITPNKTLWYGTNSTNTCQFICATEYLALAAFTLRIYPLQHKSHPTRHLRTGPIPQTHANLLRHGIPSACSIYPQNPSISAQITSNKTPSYGTNSTNTCQFIASRNT